MNRKDILLANERFGSKASKATATASPSKSYEGLTTRERKLKMAQNLGVKLVPTFGIPPPPSSGPTKTSSPVKRSERQDTTPTSNDNHQMHNQNHHQQAQNLQQAKKQKEGSPANRSKGQDKVNKEEGSQSSSPSRSHKSTNSSVVVTHPAAGASQLRMVGQHVLIMGNVENGESSHSREQDYPSNPPKSPGWLRRKKVNTDYGSGGGKPEPTSGAKVEKTGSSRFKLKLPFGRVKESKKSGQSSSKATKKPAPKPRNPPAKHAHHFSPPREPAPPPPQEAKSPLTKDSNNSHYHHSMGVNNSSKDDDRPPSPKMPPPGPATYPQFQAYTNIGSFAETTDDGNSMIPPRTNHTDPPAGDYLIPVKNQGPEDSLSSHKPVEEDRPPSPKMPPPGPAMTYPSLQPLQLQTQSFTAETTAAVKSMSKSLDSVFDDYVGMAPSPSKNQKPLELDTTSKEERPPSPKVPPPGPMSYPSLQPLSLSTTASSNGASAAGTSSMSLDSILEEFSKMSASNNIGMSMRLF